MFTNNNSTRTSGPWRWEYKDKTTLRLRGGPNTGVVVAEFSGISATDAGAIEALPELLEALEGLLANPTDQKVREAATTALEKAGLSSCPLSIVEEAATNPTKAAA